MQTIDYEAFFEVAQSKRHHSPIFYLNLFTLFFLFHFFFISFCLDDPAYCDRIIDDADDYNIIFHRRFDALIVVQFHLIQNYSFVPSSIDNQPHSFYAAKRKSKVRPNRKYTHTGKDIYVFFTYLILSIFHGGYTVLVYFLCVAAVLSLAMSFSFGTRCASEPFVLSIKWHILNFVWFTPGQRNK